MPFPDLSKEEVATHEAGHAVLILGTPLRDHLRQVRVFLENAKWVGRCEIDQRDLSLVDPHFVFEFAKNIAGPLAQAYYCPESIAPELKNQLGICPSLLGGIRDMLQNNQIVRIHFADDLQGWFKYCREHPQGTGRDLKSVETELRRFLANQSVKEVITNLAQRLVQVDRVDRAELLAIQTGDLPALVLPQRLRRV